MNTKLLQVALICTLLSTEAFAQRRIVRGFSAQTENDVFAGLASVVGNSIKNEDKDYSGGFRFEFYTDYLRQGIFPMFRNRDENIADVSKPLKLNTNSIYIQGMGFTPNRDSFVLSTPVRSQRPFSSLIGVGWKRNAIFPSGPKFFGKHRQLAIVSDIFIGKTGVKAVGNVQNFLHEYLTGSKIVNGWENQIANGGKWVLNYRVMLHLNLTYSDVKPRKYNFYLSPQLSLGNLFLNAGMKLSFTNQRISTIAQIGPITASAALGEVVFDNTDFDKRPLWRLRYEVYVRGLYVQRNSLLQGMPFYDNSTHKIEAADINRGVFDFGFRMLYPYKPDKHKLRVTIPFFEMVHRTREFKFGFHHTFGNVGFLIMSNK